MITDKAKNEIPSLPQLPTKPVRIKKTILSTDGKIIEIEEIVQIPYLAETHEDAKGAQCAACDPTEQDEGFKA